MFLVYFIVDKDHIPFYVGKGSAKRLKETLYCYGNNKHKKNKISKIIKDTGQLPEVVIYKKDLTETRALRLEKKLILAIGRKNLTNKTDGGQGMSGFRHSLETKSMISGMFKGKPKTLEHKTKLSLAKIGAVPRNKGKKFPDKTGQNHPRAKSVMLKSPGGMKIIVDCLNFAEPII